MRYIRWRGENIRMMPAKQVLKFFFVSLFLVSVLLACDTSLAGLTGSSTPALPTDDYQGSSPPALNTWSTWEPGVEVRYEHWKSPNDDDTVVITRFDLHKVRISVGYQPDQPLTMQQWMQQSGALALMNGGYFDKNNRATGMVVADGQFYGSSYTDFGGMFAVDSEGNVSLRSLAQQPYDPDNEQLEQATQSLPMMIVNGKRTQFSANSATQRRSVIALDKEGRLLLIASPAIAFSLDEFADLLASSDLSLQTALNLDGGSSTGLYLKSGQQKITISSLNPVPIMIIIKRR